MPKQSFLIGFSIFIFIGLIAFGIDYWCDKSPQRRTEKEVVAVAEPIKTKMVEEKTEDPFEDESVPEVIEPEKEVFRITAKLDENAKCFYKLERTKTPLPKNFPGQPVSIFKNTKSWRTDDGIVTTVLEFKKYNSLDDILDNIFILRGRSKDRLSLDKTAGRLVMRSGPDPWGGGGCSVQYCKKLKLPIEIITEIETLEHFASADWRFLAEIRFAFGEGQSYLNGDNADTSTKGFIVYCHINGCFSRWAENGSFQNALWKKFVDGHREGCIDVPQINKSSGFTIAIHSVVLKKQEEASDIGFSKIVIQGKDLDNKTSTDVPSAK